ncbi:hypothetical protein WR25_21085 [Diploscapter pachys]|uniref:Uncharacterized protein n=1 Tax=Diploscapter pachys TaxID=2018661 RepID=A0A2A2KFF3_9BILA|nr:hypothetical protein WR25_21085 [Diploscapter pachys]
MAAEAGSPSFTLLAANHPQTKYHSSPKSGGYEALCSHRLIQGNKEGQRKEAKCNGGRHLLNGSVEGKSVTSQQGSTRMERGRWELKEQVRQSGEIVVVAW